jgi:kynurenine formamidase
MIIDLSLPIKNNTPEPESPRIKYLDHVQGARHLIQGAKEITKGMQIELTENIFPDSMGLANEEIILDTHSGTHLDAPWHFGPNAGDKKAMTIDEIPLEWCYSDGVVLDLRHKKPGEYITEDAIKQALQNINYEIKSLDIVLIMTGADKYFDKDNYFSAHQQ